VGVSEGALILKVLPDSPAAAAGLSGTSRDDSGRIQLGDVIVAVGGTAVKKVNDLYAALDHARVGATITVAFMRNGQRQEVQVTLQVRP
jgi:S1-C subfamily serine protease